MIPTKLIHGFIYGGTNEGFFIIKKGDKAELLEDEFLDFVNKNVTIKVEVEE